MGKKVKKKIGKKGNNKKPSSNKRKAYVIKEEHPGFIYPTALFLSILAVLALANRFFFEVVGRLLPVWIGGISIIIFFSIAPFFFNKKYLYHDIIKKLTIFIITLAILSFCGIFEFATWSFPPINSADIDLSKSNMRFDLPSTGLYGIFVSGSFQGDDDSKDVKKSQI